MNFAPSVSSNPAVHRRHRGPPSESINRRKLFISVLAATPNQIVFVIQQFYYCYLHEVHIAFSVTSATVCPLILFYFWGI